MITKDINTTFQFALREMPNYNVDFKGDVSGGQFALNILGGRVSGSFRSVDDRVEWILTQKPLFLPCKVIQSFIQQYV